MIANARSRFRTLIPLMVLGLLGAGALAYVQLAPTHAELMIVSAGPVVREARGTGTLESAARVHAAFTIPGRIREIHVREGDEVKVGDVLAVLETSELDQQLALAERSKGHAARAIEVSLTSIARARVQREAAARERERTDTLYAGGAVATATWEAAREGEARAATELAAAEAVRRESQASFAVAQQSVQLQRQRLEEAVLRSPLDGVVVRRLREPGDTVSPSTTVLEVASTRKVWARVWMDETVLANLRENQPAQVSLRGGGDSRMLRARVDRVGLQTDRATHELLVDLELLERPSRLVFGQRVDAVVAMERTEATARVPRGACDLTASRCFVERDGRIADAEVRLGLIGNEWVEVVAGLRPGERLLIAGPGERLRVGRRVAERER